MRRHVQLLFWVVVLSMPAVAATAPNLFQPDGQAQIGEVVLKQIPEWKVVQAAKEGSTLAFVFSHGDDAISFYVKPATKLDMRAIFVNGSSILKSETQLTRNGISWTTLSTVRQVPVTRFAPGQTNYVFAFLFEANGKSYYGYARSHGAKTAETNAKLFLQNLSPNPSRSITGPGFTGKKYYLGWGTTNGSSSNPEMENEVKYDVLHTNDVFTKDAGGNYVGTDLIGDSVTPSQIKSAWKQISSQMTADDMYLQYSSGHGDDTELLVGVPYDDIRDNALALPAKEIVIFTMACDSGGLVNSFNAKKSVWQNWAASGRTLMVMSSSDQGESSNTGPGTDSDQPGGPDGSAGSAFGHALWKAIIGYADGYVDGVKDGFVSLAELEKYTQDDCANNYGQHPQVTGVFDGNLLMSKVPSKPMIEELERNTPGITPAELRQRLRVLQSLTRVN